MNSFDLSCFIMYNLKKRNELLKAQNNSIQDRVNIAKQTNEDIKIYKDVLIVMYEQRERELKNFKNMKGQSQKKLAKAKKLQTKIENDIKSTEYVINQVHITLNQLKRKREIGFSTKELDKEIADLTDNLRKLKRLNRLIDTKLYNLKT